jgi:hypothetical protein
MDLVPRAGPARLRAPARAHAGRSLSAPRQVSSAAGRRTSRWRRWRRRTRSGPAAGGPRRCRACRGPPRRAAGPDDDGGFLLLGLSESDSASAASDPVFLPANDTYLAPVARALDQARGGTAAVAGWRRCSCGGPRPSSEGRSGSQGRAPAGVVSHRLGARQSAWSASWFRFEHWSYRDASHPPLAESAIGPIRVATIGSIRVATLGAAEHASLAQPTRQSQRFLGHPFGC